jgi:hypothetical protein
MPSPARSLVFMLTADLQRGGGLGWVSALNFGGRTIWIVDAHRDNGKRFVVRSRLCSSGSLASEYRWSDILADEVTR